MPLIGRSFERGWFDCHQQAFDGPEGMLQPDRSCCALHESQECIQHLQIALLYEKPLGCLPKPSIVMIQ